MSSSIDAMRDADVAWQRCSKQPYDGVCGTLPQWIPKNFHIEFETARNKLLQDGHSPEYIQPFVVEVVEFLEDTSRSSDFTAPRKITGEVFTLAFFQMVVRLGKSKGLARLTDKKTAGLITKAETFTGNIRGMSALYREVLKILELIGAKASANDVWELLKSHGSEKVIKEVTEEDVYWSDDNGLEKTTQRTSFNNQLSKIRKKVQTK